MQKVRLMLSDDHLMIRDGIKLMLKKNSDFEIIAEAGNGVETIKYLENNPNTIDLILMDISMPEMDGIQATQVITKRFKNIKVIALTMHAEENYIKSMIQAGAVGYILKESGKNELVSAIRAVSSGEKYYSNAVSVTMINSLLYGEKTNSTNLSEREIEVLSQIAKGLTNKEVGANLSISGRTVETHRRNILGKLEVKNTAEMIRYAIENGLVA